MARMSGLVGGLSGKMGNAVFRQRNGQQIVAQYQPIVRNPRSENQSFQRARFKLMSQLAAVVADGLGGTMSVLSRPERKGRNPRNNFVQDNFALSTASYVAGGTNITADIDLTEIKLTKSSRPIGSLSLDTSQSSDFVKVTIRDIPDDVTHVRVMGIGSSNGSPIQIYLNKLSVVANEIVVEVPIPSWADGKKAVILAYGIIPLTSEVQQNLQNISMSNSECSVFLQQNFRDGSLSETITVAEEAIWQN